MVTDRVLSWLLGTGRLFERPWPLLLSCVGASLPRAVVGRRRGLNSPAAPLARSAVARSSMLPTRSASPPPPPTKESPPLRPLDLGWSSFSHSPKPTSPPLSSPRPLLRTVRSDAEVPLLELDRAPPPAKTAASGGGGVAIHLRAVMYGVINAVVVTPVMIGFAAIIFRDQAFHQDPAVYATLVKLVVFSSTVHQAAFTAFSSLPFAVGQVQDAGLIFLSKIAADLAQAMRDDDQEAMLATVLVTLALSTASLGVALILTGWLQLATFVQYLPLPVVGGCVAPA